MSLKDISRRLNTFLILSSGSPFVQWSGTICAIFGIGYHEEQFCYIILNFDKRFKRCPLSRALAAPLFSVEEPFVKFW